MSAIEICIVILDRASQTSSEYQTYVRRCFRDILRRVSAPPDDASSISSSTSLVEDYSTSIHVNSGNTTSSSSAAAGSGTGDVSTLQIVAKFGTYYKQPWSEMPNVS